ncbi:WD40 repeat-like protein [Suillus decipiens]|nr:WD40 repeat-like protein [Suillus decipiens]
MALSPDGKTVATGSRDGVMKLWNVDTGKVIKTWTGHTEEVSSVCWSPNGGRVVSVSWDGIFRIWDVKSGETILGPINAGEDVYAVCYSPDAKMSATGRDKLKVWDANTGELLKIIEGYCPCLAWTSDGKTLFAGRLKLDTATWTVLHEHQYFPDTISLSPNERILATTSYWDKTVQLWNTETDQPIGTPLHHEDEVNSATFSANGKFLVTGCNDNDLYTWDVSAIVKEAGLPSDIVTSSDADLRSSLGAVKKPGFNPDVCIILSDKCITLDHIPG